MSGKNVAVVGATGAVGEVMIELLESRAFPVENLFLLASERSAGTRLPFNGQNLRVENLADFDFSRADVALFSAGGSISAEYAPRAGSRDRAENAMYYRSQRNRLQPPAARTLLKYYRPQKTSQCLLG